MDNGIDLNAASNKFFCKYEAISSLMGIVQKAKCDWLLVCLRSQNEECLGSILVNCPVSIRSMTEELTISIVLAIPPIKVRQALGGWCSLYRKYIVLFRKQTRNNDPQSTNC